VVDRTYKAFLSCSFAPEDERLRTFFKELVEALHFQCEVYDYQEIGSLSSKIKEQIVRCDCLIAIVAKREKIEGSNLWSCSDWVHDELALANAYQKPIAIFCEKDVKIEGLIAAEERRQVFTRDQLIDTVPQIVKFLFNLRSYLGSIGSSEPTMLRHYVHVREDFQSAEILVTRVDVMMESLTDRLDATYHTTEIEDLTPGLSVRPRHFDFVCKESPFGTKVEPEVYRSTERKHIWRLNFTPPLKRGDKVRYAFKYIQQNTRPWTLVEVNQRIKQGTYELKTPICKACDWMINFPTVELRVDVEFPEGYEISDCEVDVKTGEINLSAEQEMRRIRDGAMFTAEKLIDKWSLSLLVPKPLQDHTYFIYYAPMT
jgi:hypothetical protein